MEQYKIQKVEVKTDGQIGETVVGTLSAGTTYKIGYTKNLNKVQSSAYTLQNLITQKFEGIVSCDDIRIENIVYNNSNNPNNVIIQLAGNDVNRVAAATVTFNNGKEEITTGLMKLDTENGNYLVVDLLELLNNQNFSHFIDRDITLSVTAYYDNGRIGFIPDDGEKYATYTNSENSYMTVEGNSFIKTEGEINGNMFEYRYYALDDKVQLGIKTIDNINNNQNGTTLDLQYSPSGLKQNDNIIVQKEVVAKQVDRNIEHKINIKKYKTWYKI